MSTKSDMKNHSLTTKIFGNCSILVKSIKISLKHLQTRSWHFFLPFTFEFLNLTLSYLKSQSLKLENHGIFQCQLHFVDTVLKPVESGSTWTDAKNLWHRLSSDLPPEILAFSQTNKQKVP